MILEQASKPATPRSPLLIIADDEEWSARAYESVLSANGYSVIRCKSGSETLERAQTAAPDALLIKSSLPDVSAPDLCKVLRDRAHVGATTPIIVSSSAAMRRAERLNLLSSGAWDLVNMPVDLDELILRLGVYIRCKQEADRVRNESLLDSATGLYSIHGLLRRVREVSLDAHRYRSAMACAVFGPDDRWAEVAAESDPQTGLTPIAERMVRLITQVARGSDTIGRLSQSEFVVIASRTNAEGVLRLAQRMHQAADEMEGDSEGEAGLRIRAGCYALGEVQQDDTESVDILVRATLALRRAQREESESPICFFGTAPYPS